MIALTKTSKRVSRKKKGKSPNMNGREKKKKKKFLGRSGMFVNKKRYPLFLF
jgi:hypothetical protein